MRVGLIGDCDATKSGKEESSGIHGVLGLLAVGVTEVRERIYFDVN
jgi:hypothetical protein